jgi:hypothetical protein
MEARTTGSGKLSRKLLTILVLSGMTTLGYATDNSIYIDQAGDNSTITMTQDGAGNRVKGILTNGTAGASTDPAKLVGNNQTVTINQAGPNNILTLGANSTIGTNGKGIDINYSVDVGGNIGFINSNNNGQGVSASNLIDIIQLGGNAVATISMLGNTNSLTVRSSGGGGNSIVANIDADNVTAVVDQTLGGGNDTTLNLTGNKGGVNITSTGATNISDVTQSGGGVNGNDVKIVLNGSGNQTTVSQVGVNDNAVDYKVVGSNNIANIVQSGGLSLGQYAKADIAGSNNDIGITQQGSVDNLTNIKITGSYNTYRILQKN